MNNYINYVPKTLQEDFINNKVVPLVGAGFSKNADIPKGVNMPDWNQLGKKIAEYIDGYEYVNAIDALSLFESEYSRVKLIEVMARELNINKIKPSDTYRAFCDVFFEIICTTNFDFLIEQTLSQTSRPYSVIITEDRLPISTQEDTQVIKLHGDFNHPKNMVITEKDYDSFIDNNKILSTYVSNIFITKTLFLVGYSFDDADIRGIWQVINSRLGNLNRLAYCVMVDANATEVARFERRNIRVINLPGKKEDYPKILKEFFEDIKELIDENTPKRMKATNERTMEEFVLPPEESKMCFISAQFNKIPFLKDTLYPILEDKGLTPVSLDEVILQGDNWMSKSEAIIKKTFIAIVDISNMNKNVIWEFNTLLKNKKNIIIICEENSVDSNSYILNEFNIIEYGYDKIDELYDKLQSEIEKIIEKDKQDFLNEAQRLIKKQEYNAAAIAAFRKFEMAVRNKYENNNIRRLPLVSIVNKLVEDNKLVNIDINDIKRISNLRNRLVHEGAEITKKDAVYMMETIEKLIKQLEERND